MRLERVEIRFFKSFNFDYERKWREDSEPKQWEDVTDGWFPFVRVKVDNLVTAVVGANEAGKTQFLDATEVAVTGDGISESDFCRYSALYSVERGKIRAPEFGAAFVADDEASVAALVEILPKAEVGQRFVLYRPGREPAFIVPAGSEEPIYLEPQQLLDLEAVLPPIFRLNTHLGMPDTLSIDELAGNPHQPLQSRRRRTSILTSIREGAWDAPTEFGASIFPILQTALAEPDTEAEKHRRLEFKLGRRLLVDIARIDPSTFERLQKAIDNEEEGEIEGLIRAMNTSIAENLNFKRWWTQDSDFEIEVKARERELALVIRDRTTASYSFDERSQGLRYFLSYFVQLTAHRQTLERNEVMLLDEPDAYLSSQGQQDLLRVLEDYANPEASGPRNQVIYVTHSPFLIDRNAGHRIRVLDKGSEDEGTRVVKDATQNHYEPLRSSLGASVAETAFIGGANLFVEGMADQVLIAGAASHLRRVRNDHDYLDLNAVTIVPCGSAESIPYMVFLARGRDQVKPASVALFDGDPAGKGAASTMRERLVHKRAVIPEACIVELDIWAASVKLQLGVGVVFQEIEDLIHPDFAILAARAHARAVEGFADAETDALRVEELLAQIAAKKGSMWDGMAASYKKAYKGAHIEKVGFAREVIGLLAASRRDGTARDGQAQTESNLAALVIELSNRLEAAATEETQRRGSRRLNGKIREFERDHKTGITKRIARSLLREIDQILDRTDSAEHVRVELAAIRRDFDLDEQISEPVAKFDEFAERIRRLSLSQRLTLQDAASQELQERGD